ncbi:MAG TPA: hypothetical protein VFZ65_02010 [Planctomycetota bacterium]|nr:hypothetical protein [Planctomycetota bacterium]
MLDKLPMFGALSLLAAVPAQTTAVIPSAFALLPGNAALAMPLRWSQGTMQVRIGASQLPAGLIGQTITGLRLRRPSLAGDVAYGALQRTLTVRGGFQTQSPVSMGTGLLANRPATTSVLFGPATVNVAPTPAPGPASTVGPSYLQIVFSQPLPVVAGTLFLEFEASDAPLQFAPEHWVDGVWIQNGVETGYAARFGDGSCTTRPERTELRWNDAAQGPHVGGTAALELSGAPPTNATSAGFVLCWAAVAPQTRPPSATYAGFGGPLSVFDPGLVGCHQWAPFDVTWFGVTDATGRFHTSFALTSGAFVGMRLGVQAAWFDESRAGLPLSFSNGLVLVLSSVGVGDQCATAFFPAASATSPWLPFVGQMPVITLEY